MKTPATDPDRLCYEAAREALRGGVKLGFPDSALTILVRLYRRARLFSMARNSPLDPDPDLAEFLL